LTTFAAEGTPYFGGKFRLKLVISAEYPAAPPKGYFITKIYHPNVASNGDICVNTLKRDWTPDVTLKHVFQVIRCLLIIPFPESSLNDEAGKLFMDSYDEFARRARIMTEVGIASRTAYSYSPS
jgi:ubiquitin-protein ligase